MRVIAGILVTTLLLGGAALAVDDPDNLMTGTVTVIKPQKLVKFNAKPAGDALPSEANAPTTAGGSLQVSDTGQDGNDDTYALPASGWKRIPKKTTAPLKGYKFKGDTCKNVIVKANSVKAVCKGSAVQLTTPFTGDASIVLTLGADSKRYCALFGGTGKNDTKKLNRKGAPAPAACPIVGGGCCNGAGFVSVVTRDEAGDCGDILDNNGMLVANINCSGLYSGGGGNAVPLPFTVPDQGTAVSAITSCTGQTATLGGTTSTQTGSNRNCSDIGCVFGAPLAVPNPGSTPTSVCVLNAASATISGTVACDTGATTVNLPLTSVIFLTGDSTHDPVGTINGIQPCPLCSAGSCVGGPNAGSACTPGTTTLGGNPAYPTSHDCPPDPMFSIGSLPIAFTLSSGTVTWTGTPATNDSDTTASPLQPRVFSGFCRDGDGTGSFSGTDAATAQKCWENGVAVGAACSGVFESCTQRNSGAFGPSGGSNRTITAIGAGSSLLSGPANGKLVSVFTIPPTFNSTVDAAGDLPGPGAVALPGTATLCADVMACP